MQYILPILNVIVECIIREGKEKETRAREYIRVKRSVTCVGGIRDRELKKNERERERERRGEYGE